MNNKKTNIKTKNRTNNIKKALLFALTLLPVAIVGGICTAFYQFDALSPDVVETAISQVGSMGALVAITAVQTALYTFIAGFVGYIVSNKIGLIKPFTFKKNSLITSLLFGAGLGVLIGVDHFVSGAIYPEIQNVISKGFAEIEKKSNGKITNLYKLFG